MRSVAGAMAVALVAGALVTAPPAPAVVPGPNGPLACEGTRPTDPTDPASGADFEVFTVLPDGTGEQRLTTHPARDGDPSWSPDGTRIAFESYREDGDSEVYVMNADGTGVTRLTFNDEPGRVVEDRGTSWSPDGTKIAFHSGRHFVTPSPGLGFNSLEIFTMDADGQNQTRLTHNGFQDSLPSWSPDGTKIAFTTNRDGDYEIYVMNTDGSDPTRLTFSPGEDAHPMWSPDGDRIAFHSRRMGDLDIFVMDADGTDVVQLTGAGSLEFFPVWSPDGTKIAFTGNTIDTSNFDVYVMDADGTDIQQVTFSPGFDGRCDWGRLTPATKDDCKRGGWQRFNTADTERFRNQGQCIAFVNGSERDRL